MQEARQVEVMEGNLHTALVLHRFLYACQRATSRCAACMS